MKNRDYINDINLKVDKKQLINQLRALSDNYVNLHINSKDLTWLSVADSKNYNRMATKN